MLRIIPFSFATLNTFAHCVRSLVAGAKAPARLRLARSLTSLTFSEQTRAACKQAANATHLHVREVASKQQQAAAAGFAGRPTALAVKRKLAAQTNWAEFT